MNKHSNPLFDQYGIYRQEAIRFQRESRVQALALAGVAGVAIAVIAVCCWMLAAG